MKILKHPIFEPCTCDKCMTAFQVDADDELNTVFYEGVIQAWKIECPVCRHWCNLKWAGIINPSDVTDTNVGHKSEWISVENPPDDYRDEYGELIPFLVCCHGTEYPFRALYDGKNWGDGIGVLRVTHWMPLPEPPEPPKGE